MGVIVELANNYSEVSKPHFKPNNYPEGKKLNNSNCEYFSDSAKRQSSDINTLAEREDKCVKDYLKSKMKGLKKLKKKMGFGKSKTDYFRTLKHNFE